MIKKFKEFVNESIESKWEFIEWLTGFKNKYKDLKSWDWMMDTIVNNDMIDDDELKEYLLSEVSDLTEDIVDELLLHRHGFLTNPLILYTGSEYQEDPELHIPSSRTYKNGELTRK